MKICLLSNHSAENVELARLTAQNRWDYSARHGYDLVTLRMTYEECMVGAIKALVVLLRAYDKVFVLGTDVVITNPSIKIEERFTAPGALVFMSREIDGRSPINNDVAVYNNDWETGEFLQRIIWMSYEWKTLPNLWQSYVAQTPGLLSLVTILEPRALNATDQSGDWLWQPGDFVCHCLGGHNASKVERCRAVLEKL